MTDDKAVSTEDLCYLEENATSLEAARLEAVIRTLVENKLDSFRDGKSRKSSVFKKLKGNNSNSTLSSAAKKAGAKEKLHFGKHGHKFYQQTRKSEGEIQLHLDDDFISLNIEDYPLDAKEIASMQKLRRIRKKRRRRRRKVNADQEQEKVRKQLAMTVQMQELADLDEDELSQRARITIALTAGLLLFMCLLLVGITLRMAPLIDDMVRKENEELMNSMIAQDLSNHNFTASVPYK